MSAARLRRLKLLVLDVDGVLTDGRLHYGAGGEQLLAFHVRDGHGIKALQKAGVEVAVISGRRSAAAAARCAELGIRRVVQGAQDKARALQAICGELGARRSEVACMGDDTPDLAMFRLAAVSIAVADAHPAVRRAANLCTRAGGGLGAVREICDRILKARGVAPHGTGNAH